MNKIKTYIISIIYFMFMLANIGSASWDIINSVGTDLTFKKVSLEPVAYIIGKDMKFTSIEKALEVAVSGDIVTVYPGEKDNYCDKPNESNKVWQNLEIPDKVTYNITRNCEIKPGVTLLIPTDIKSLSTVTDKASLNNYINNMKNDDRNRGSASSYGKFGNENENKYLRTTINVNDGVTITNNGNFIVSGYLGGGSNSSGKVGQTSHSYSKVNLGTQAKIVQNNENANLYCFGYIDELIKNNGSILQLSSGKMHMPFVVLDYKGFTSSFAMTDGAIDVEKCTPFNQFIFPNISINTEIYSNAYVNTYVNIFISYSSPNVNQNFLKEIPLIGKEQNYVININDNAGFINYKYDPITTVAKIKMFGNQTLNNIDISLSASGLNIDLSTSKSYFPISYHYDIELNGNNNQTTSVFNTQKQLIKLLPGAKMKINKNATLNGSEVIVYTSFHDGSKYNGYSSQYLGGVNYPLKEGASLILNEGKIIVNALAGTVYGNEANITSKQNVIVSKEPWTLKSSGKLKPPWTISDFLEIHEELQILPLNTINLNKIYCGTNIFENYNVNIPKYSVILSDGKVKEVNKYQKVFIINDNVNSYKLDFKDNIYKAFKYNVFYNKDESVQYNKNNSLIGIINSTMPISSNNAGVNEFNVTNMNVICTTPLIDNKIPLYVGGKIKLQANIEHYEKVYNKNISWSSSDITTATVDKDGNVEGKKLGPVKITATCDGVSASIDLNVIEKGVIQEIQSLTITDNHNNSSEKSLGEYSVGNRKIQLNGKYKNGTDVVLKVNINPQDAPYSSIKWTFHASAAGRQYIYDKTKTTEIIENTDTVTIHIVSGSGASDDNLYIDCEVTDMNGIKHLKTFGLVHKADTICVNEGSDILMGDGTYKKVEDVNLDDILMVFNHENGKFESAPLIAIIKHQSSLTRVTILTFDDGSKLEIIGNHDLFDYTLKRYVSMTDENCINFINHEFASYNSGQLSTKKLIKVDHKDEYTTSYMLVTYEHKNFIAENILTGDSNSNYFEFDENLKYDEKSKQQDIEKYGIIHYEDVDTILPQFIYDGFNIKYYNVLLGKGLITEIHITEWLELSNYLLETGELQFNPKYLK